METKTFSGYLFINWKDEDMKLRKTKKKSPNPYEVVTEVSIDVEVPDVEVPQISKVIEVSEVEVREAVAELVELEGVTEEHPNPREILMHDSEYLIENFPEERDSAVEEEDLEWIRSLLAYEYQNSNRREVIDFLEDKLSSYKDRVIE